MRWTCSNELSWHHRVTHESWTWAGNPNLFNWESRFEVVYKRRRNSSKDPRFSYLWEQLAEDQEKVVQDIATDVDGCTTLFQCHCGINFGGFLLHYRRCSTVNPCTRAIDLADGSAGSSFSLQSSISHEHTEAKLHVVLFSSGWNLATHTSSLNTAVWTRRFRFFA